MATAGKNLSAYDSSKIPSANGMKIGIVVSEWNNDITEGLLQGAEAALLQNNINPDQLIVEWVPGSYELPLGAQYLLEDDSFDGVICLGSVIRGETAHFDFVCQGCSQGIMDVGLKYSKPVIFGVLTDDNKQQSIDRSGGKHGNKGTEAAITAIKMIDLKKRLG